MSGGDVWAHLQPYVIVWLSVMDVAVLYRLTMLRLRR